MDWKNYLMDLSVKIFAMMTPDLRRELCNALKELGEEAKTTPNPLDDIAIEFLILLTKCEED